MALVGPEQTKRTTLVGLAQAKNMSLVGLQRSKLVVGKWLLVYIPPHTMLQWTIPLLCWAVL